MRRLPSEDLDAAVSRRLAALVAHSQPIATMETLQHGPVDRTGRNGDEPPAASSESDDLLTGEVIRAPGRHRRARSVSRLQRVVENLPDYLPPWLLGRLQIGARHIVVLSVVLAVAVVATTVWFYRPKTATPLPELTATQPADIEPLIQPAPTLELEEAEERENAESLASGTAGAPAPEQIVVDVAGKVKRPGVVTLPAGARVNDAIDQAGGPKKGVSLTDLNLARVLVDGEQVLVGVAPARGVAADAMSQQVPQSDSAAPEAVDGLININTATAAQLESLPGVGPVTAANILAWRAANGAFSTLDELLEVPGIGEKRLAQLAPRLTL